MIIKKGPTLTQMSISDPDMLRQIRSDIGGKGSSSHQAYPQMPHSAWVHFGLAQVGSFWVSIHTAAHLGL